MAPHGRMRPHEQTGGPSGDQSRRRRSHSRRHSAASASNTSCPRRDRNGRRCGKRLARQKTEQPAGSGFHRCWHETLAVNMAMGYTQYSGKMQAVLLHAGVGLMQGEIGIHTARNFEVPMVVMSGESVTYGEDPSVEPGAQWYRQPRHRRRATAPRRAGDQMVDPGDQRVFALREHRARRRIVAAQTARAGLSQRADRDADRRMDAADQTAQRAAAAAARPSMPISRSSPACSPRRSSR